jgi:archaellum component FlaC
MGQRAQIDHIKQVLDDREDDLIRVDALMGGLLDIAKQVGVETKKQDEKLDVV